MDSPTGSWFSALGVNEPNMMEQFDFVKVCNMEEEFATGFAKDFPEYILSSPTGGSSTTTTTTTVCTAVPLLEQPPATKAISNSSSGPLILNFSNAINKPPENSKTAARALNISPPEKNAWNDVINGSLNASESVQVAKKTRRVRPPYDHITAERKRREVLSQRFVALSTMVPGLKKMDKTKVLGDTIKYLKHLQEKVKSLEEQRKKETVESVVLVRRNPKALSGSGWQEPEAEAEQPLPEIEARRCDSQILLKINCEKRTGVLAELIRQVEKLNLNVLNTNVAPFGNLALYITIVAEMEKEFNSTVKDVAKDIRSTLLQQLI